MFFRPVCSVLSSTVVNPGPHMRGMRKNSTAFTKGRLPKDLLYGELVEGSRHAGRPKLRFKDVCKRDMKRCNIDSNSWESIADDRPSWRQTVKQGAKFAEEALTTAALDKRSRRKERGKYPQQPTPFSCTRCGRDCHSRVGLHSHSRKCR